MRDDLLEPTDLTWLARLARALLGEPHAADDLVQETVVAALDGPPPSDVPRRAWLGAVARRLAARRFRGEARRARREQRAARPEALPDAADLVARAEIAERVTRATRRLPEPFRRTILLRYLEGLSSEEIAQREGKPVDTVRWRVRRGLALLRAELARGDGGDWSSFSVLLVPVARSGGSAGLATTGASGALAGSVATWIAMNATKLTLGLTAAVICGGGLWLAASAAPRGPDAPPGADRVASLLPARSETPPAATADRVDASRGPARVPVERPELGGGAAAVRLAGRVVDGRGNSVSEATVYLVERTASEGARRRRGGSNVLTRVESDRRGEFRFVRSDSEGSRIGAAKTLDLGVVANGFLREVVPDVLQEGEPTAAARSGAGLLIVLRQGQSLMGHVVDQRGRVVPDLQLLAHTDAGAAINHVSPSQMMLRASRAVLASGRSPYQQCRGRTDARGVVTFTGLPPGWGMVRSLDPGWTIDTPARVELPGPYVVWTAKRRLGVRLSVVDARAGTPVKRASAVFRAELTFGDGETEDFGQWVGRGEAEVSFVMTGEELPQLRERTVVRAVFYGTVKVGDAKTSWRAPPIEHPVAATGVAEVRVAVDRSAPHEVAAAAPDTPAAAPRPAVEVDLDVRSTDGSGFEGELAVDWTSVAEGVPMREGSARLEPRAPGRYQFSVAAGTVKLRVADRNASGSLEPWTGQVQCRAGQPVRVYATLPSGAAVTIRRPEGWEGEWWVRASWRPANADDWRGSWGYSTTEPTLRLAALKPAEWRFELRRGSERAPDPLVRTVRLSSGGDVVVD